MHGPVVRRVAVVLATLTALLGLAISPALAAAPPAWPEVRNGEESVEVLTVQHLLRNQGATITADGVFGPNTLAAVTDFQAESGLAADGLVDTDTWLALAVPLDDGATGEAVRALQLQLNRYGFGLDVDGDFGPLTGAAVAEVRALFDLGGGTAVDATFWQWLVGSAPPGEQVAPGVEFSSMQIPTPHGMALGYVLTVDLTQASVGLLWPGRVAQTATTSAQADRLGAVAGVNGDFYNIGQTGAPVGPAVVDGHALKAAVPGAQRYGPTRPPGTDNAHVFGITSDGSPTVTTLDLAGTATTPEGSFDLEGLNQYAIPVDGVGIFTADWGSQSRERATCGTDTDRNGPCSTETAEVEIVDGTVTRVSDEPGSGQIDADATVLVARDAGVAQLDGLAVGDSVSLDYGLVSGDGTELRTAIGGLVLAMDGEQLTLDDDPATLAPRTAVGSSADGSTLYLVAVDGRSGSSVGATLRSMADIMADLGATQDVINLDGGGSTTLVAREGDSTTTSVRNTPSDGSQRSVANGLGVFSE
ncbi:phosphodiester glycosidase family protein [Streptomyces sp. B6B3]|uniref:phosphodiester glycosidase family protein n=1 Tax=Streptomyces sp. B6B3 TaxID=3153570 RepID=UPI00325DF64F